MTTTTIAPPRCQCEHVSHLTVGGITHGYLEAAAGAAAAYFVGPVCDDCAATHAAPFLRRVAS